MEGPRTLCDRPWKERQEFDDDDDDDDDPPILVREMLVIKMPRHTNAPIAPFKQFSRKESAYRTHSSL